MAVARALYAPLGAITLQQLRSVGRPWTPKLQAPGSDRLGTPHPPTMRAQSAAFGGCATSPHCAPDWPCSRGSCSQAMLGRHPPPPPPREAASGPFSRGEEAVATPLPRDPRAPPRPPPPLPQPSSAGPDRRQTTPKRAPRGRTPTRSFCVSVRNAMATHGCFMERCPCPCGPRRLPPARSDAGPPLGPLGAAHRGQTATCGAA